MSVKLSDPNDLTPALRRILPPGTRQLRAVVVRQFLAPDGKTGSSIEYDQELGGPEASILMLAQGIQGVYEAEGKKAAAQRIEAPAADQVQALLAARGRNGVA